MVFPMGNRDAKEFEVPQDGTRFNARKQVESVEGRFLIGGFVFGVNQG